MNEVTTVEPGISPAQGAMIKDLARSGLVPADLKSRVMGPPEKAMTRTPHSVTAYLIPYFDVNGKPIGFYRARLLDGEVKYKQPMDSGNHVYFPPGFKAAQEGKGYVLITEGEKKAALACKLGFPCAAFGGVDSWRNRTLILSADSELKTDDKRIVINLPQGQEAHERTSSYAEGFQQLIDHIVARKLQVIIIYDTDVSVGTKPEVQRAAARLGFELRYNAIPFDHIRQLILPQSSAASAGIKDKMGLDDYLLAYKAPALETLIRTTLAKKSAFPRYPGIVEYLNRRLGVGSKIARKDFIFTALASLADLDSSGLRLKNEAEGAHYYFNYDDHRLMRAVFPTNTNDRIDNNIFAHHLYRRFGISQADRTFLVWLGAQFTGEQPVDEVQPYRVLARPVTMEDRVIYQINDGQFATVAARTDQSVDELPGIEVWDNGDRGVLFESEQVTEIKPSDLLVAYAEEAAEGRPKCKWLEVLKDARFKDKEKQMVIAALLFYVSPWLYRWRGTQLPVEMILGEPGSGKSTIYETRLQILTGKPKLRNAPTDLRDWHASISNAGALHVTDNMAGINRELHQRLSDEMCRLVTEPSPSIDMRRLYTTAEVASLPVSIVFAVTAIKQPFMNPDIIQRSIVLELDKAQDIQDGQLLYDANWKQRQIDRFGGRPGWIAHHLYVLHWFFKLVEKEWNPNYGAKHRLQNFEQAMILMGKVFRLDTSWMPDYLAKSTNLTIAASDWVLQALREFADLAKEHGITRRFEAKDVSEWALSHEDHHKNEVLCNPRKLGKYMQTHRATILTACDIMEMGLLKNRQTYQVKL